MALPTYSGGNTFAGKTSTARIREFKSLTCVNYVKTTGSENDDEIIAAPASGKTINVWALHVGYTSTAATAGVWYALHDDGRSKDFHIGSMRSHSNTNIGNSDWTVLDMPISVGDAEPLNITFGTDSGNRVISINVFYTVDNV